MGLWCRAWRTARLLLNVMNIFFDTEFTTLDRRTGYPALISVGCVTQDGREFYAELDNTWNTGICSQFVVETVLPLLQGGEYRISDEQCALRLKDWIENLTDEEVILISDSPGYDWPWVADLFQFFGCWPKNLRRRCGVISFEEEIQLERFNEALECFWKSNEKQQHHALVDAASLFFAWSQAAGVKGFIKDKYAAQNEINRREFGELVKRGLAKASDASMFHGLARNSKVRWPDEEF